MRVRARPLEFYTFCCHKCHTLFTTCWALVGYWRFTYLLRKKRAFPSNNRRKNDRKSSFSLPLAPLRSNDQLFFKKVCACFFVNLRILSFPINWRLVLLKPTGRFKKVTSRFVETYSTFFLQLWHLWQQKNRNPVVCVRVTRARTCGKCECCLLTGKCISWGGYVHPNVSRKTGDAISWQ